jgi:F-type H+-transporting ATPase subunit delta
MSANFKIARPYAKAAFELAQNQKAFAKWSDMMALASGIASDKTVVDVMKDPKFSRDQLLALFLDLGKDSFTPEMNNFIQTLSRFKRLALLPEIAMLYEEMRAQAERVVTVELISAQPVSDDFKQRFQEALKRKTNSNITLEVQTDKSIIGGAIIRAGDLVIDGSIRGRLAKLSDAVGIS